MVKKKVVSLIMVIAMLLTVVSVIPSAFSAENADLADTAAALDYNLSSNVQSGNILHAFNWRMTDLVKYAPEIAAAGYSTVQISPIQNTKVTANDGSYATDWWSFYQPTDMKIGNALGSADDLKAATTELHKYGIKVIADVVTNHSQDSSGDKKIAANISAALKSFLRHSPTGKHTAATDNSRDSMTHNDMGGKLTDIDTGNKDYQNYVINNLLIPLINNGVDGFRFDAAKHIETPDDGSSASDYWPTVTSAIKGAKSDAFIYGEVLSLANKLSVTSYTKYMSVTDYAFGDTVRSALSNKNASNLVNYGYTGSQKKDNVLWVESHDTFCDNKSTSLTKKQQILGWAVIGARKDAPALFFVRPKHEELDSVGFIKYDDLMGAPGAADTWKDPTVVAVNRFKNAFIGQDETTSASGANLFIQRGTTGMVIVNLNGSSTSISQSCTMANGSYKDQVSGATFQVSGGKITGTVGSTGVAVIYNLTTANSAPTISLKLDGTELNAETLNRYTAATATIDVEITNATSATVKVSNLSAKTVSTGKTTFKLNSSIPYGKSIDITVTASNGSKNVSRTYNIKKKDATETKKVYFDNTNMKWPGVWVYCKTGEAASTQIAKYDEYKLTGDINGVLSYTVPANTNYVKFNEGYIGPDYTDKSHTDEYGRCHLMHTYQECQGYCGRTMPETVVNYGTANEKANREKGGYQLVGAMILRNLRFEDYGEYPVATLSASDTTLSGSDAPTEKPTTAPPTQPTTADPTVPAGTTARMGDADNDGKVTIVDATRIQRVLAGLTSKSPYYDIVADIDQDKKVTIVDATCIQRWLAGLPNQKQKIDVLVNVSGGTAPTEEPTYAEPTWEDDPTEAPYNPAVGPLPNRYVALIYCEAFSTDPASRTIEKEFDKSTGTLTYDFPGDSYVFVRNYDTGVQYCTDGWTNFANPVTLVNQASLANESDFEKMFVPAGTHTLYLSVDKTADTCTLGYGGGSTTPVVTPTTGGDPAGDSDILFIPGAGAEADPAWYAWVWNEGSQGKWIAGVESGSNIVFPGACDYTNMLVARMPSGSTNPNWDDCWNQSEDITIQPGKTLAFKSWGSGKKFLIEWK
jgi:alpha-amylase